MDENKLKNSLQRIPDVIKGWLGLIIGIAGIIIAIRTDQQLYAVIFIGIVLAIWLFSAIYIVLARMPGTFSKKGLYRYESYRWAGFISIGIVIGFIFSFYLFTPNRSYVSQAFVGTLTPPASPTFIPFTETATLTPFPTMTETLMPTPTPIVLFQENFLNNNNGWDFPVSDQSQYSTGGRIIGSKLEYGLYCGSSFSYDCDIWFQIPHITAKNFDLMLDTRITNITSSETPFDIGVKFREAAGAYYIVYFSNKGTVSVFLSGNGLYDFIAKDVFSSSIKQGLNETNHFRIIAQDAMFIIYANGQEITVVEDGNNSSIGKISLGMYLPQRGNGGTVEIDNIQIQEVP